MTLPSNDPVATEDERRILLYIGLNPNCKNDDIVESLNFSPDYIEEMKERLAYIGILLPMVGDSVSKNTFKDLTLREYHEYRVLLLHQKLDNRGILKLRYIFRYGSRSFIFQRAMELGYRKENDDEFKDIVSQMQRENIIEPIAPFEEYKQAVHELRPFKS